MCAELVVFVGVIGGLVLGKNRDRIDIVAAVLKAAGDGSNKTRIMFNANLSYQLLEKYLRNVIHLGFVAANGSDYRLTDEGRLFLLRYQSFDDNRVVVEQSARQLAEEHILLKRLCSTKPFDHNPGLSEDDCSE